MSCSVYIRLNLNRKFALLCPSGFNVRSEVFLHMLFVRKIAVLKKGSLFAFNVLSVKSVFRLSSGILLKVLLLLLSFLGEIQETQAMC